MTKRIYTLLSLMVFAFTVNAQVDTVFLENFQVEPAEEWAFIPFGDDTDWVNVDADGINPSSGDPIEMRWFFTEFFYDAVDTIAMDTNICVASLSWMENYAPGNRNWLITPPIFIDDDTHMLHFSTAPFQLPRYMDGLSVLVSTNGNDMLAAESPFLDTLYRIASMDAITGDGQSIDVSNYSFTPGYVHADNVSNWDYFVPWEEGDTTVARGLLEPHSLDLSAYAGETIYIAFVHDADDDYYMALDDVMVTKGMAVSANDLKLKDLRFQTYPNPVRSMMNVSYFLTEGANISMYITDMNGRMVRQISNNQQEAAGWQTHQLQLQNLPVGNYNVVLNVDGQITSKLFNKH
ncbi:MAG: choice-of-anchor J domain-containing protein [Saprospiraceae bacterium]